MLETKHTNKLKKADTAYEPVSGRMMDVFTTEIGVHLYIGNYLSDDVLGKNKVHMHHRSGFFLKRQHFGDHPNFSTTLLEPGQTLTVKRFASLP